MDSETKINNQQQDNDESQISFQIIEQNGSEINKPIENNQKDNNNPTRETFIDIQSNQNNDQNFQQPFQEIKSLSTKQQSMNQIQEKHFKDEDLNLKKVNTEVSKSKNLLNNNGEKESLTFAQRRKVVIEAKYIDQLQKHDQKRQNDHLISYFCTIGMDESDIFHTIMIVKELEKFNCGLNQYQYDDMIANPHVLYGERVYNFINEEKKSIVNDRKSCKSPIAKQPDHSDKIKVPAFQPQIISQVPNVNRSKLLFPINLADFLFPQGVQVLPANQVIHLNKNHQDLKNSQNLNPYLDVLPILQTHPFNKSFNGTQNSGIEKEIMLTNQEGKIYYATCYDYFIDLRSLFDEFQEQGKFERYSNKILQSMPDQDQIDLDIQKITKEILEQQIPNSTYFIPFSLCIVSIQSYKKQFLTILDRLYTNYVNQQFRSSQQFVKKLSLEEAINRIVFGIPNPNSQYEYLYKNKQINSCNQIQFVKVQLSEDVNDIVVFKNKDNFDLNCSQLENLCVLFCKLPSENILQLFKRILFNTCTIITSSDQSTSEKCIQGIMQLFYPLNSGITCVPSLIQSKLEYIKLCNQSVIGVSKKIQSKIQFRNAQGGLSQQNQKNKMNMKLLTEYYFDEIKQKLKEDNKKQKQENDELKLIRSDNEHEDQSKIDSQQENEDSKWQDKLFDIMQDNSCLIALHKSKKHHPLQKPIQSICFNSKGKLSYGQGAAQKGQRKQRGIQLENGIIVDNNQNNGQSRNYYNYGGVTETLNDVELPSDWVQKIKDLIQDAQKMNYDIWDKKNNYLKNYVKSLQGPQRQSEQVYFEAYKNIQKFLMKIKEVKYCFFQMIRDILRFYILKQGILFKFKGKFTQSGHMKNYLAWQASMDIFQLIDRNQFKQYLKEEGGDQQTKTQFFKKLIYYPSLQNYICDKFFPNKNIDNFRQLLILLDQKQLEDFTVLNDQHIKNEYFHIKDSQQIYQLFAFEQKTGHQEDQNCTNKKCNNEERKIKDDYFGKDQKNNVFNTFNKIVIENVKKETIIFPRYLNNEELRRDFLENYSQNKIGYKEENNSENIIQNIIQNMDQQKQSQLAPVHDIQYRMASQLLYFNPKVDLIVSWILLFLGSIDYLTDPFIFIQLEKSDDQLPQYQKQYKPSEYYESQKNQNIWLGYIFQKTLRMLIYKGDYEFNPRCPLLALLFQYTHKNYYLHQKLMEVVNEDIDQQQSGGQVNSGITVSSQFILYQIHWQGKQIHNKAKNTTFQKLLNFNKFYNPYQDWTFNEKRIKQLEKLQKLEYIQLQKDQNERNIVNLNYEELNEKYGQFILANRNEENNGRKRSILQRIFQKKEKKQHNEINDPKMQEYILLKQINDQIQCMKNYDKNFKDMYNSNKDIKNQEFQQIIGNQLQKTQLRSSNITVLSNLSNQKNQINQSMVFYDLSKKQRSFFTLSQIRQSKMIECTINNSDQQEYLQLVIDLVEVKCKECGKQQEINMDQIINNYPCKHCKKNLIVGTIHIYLQCEFGVFLIKKANLNTPKRIRSEVESLLQMDIDKSYRILHQIDLSAFSQSIKNKESDLYWNLIFWFKYIDLPYQWLAPFSAHLQEFYSNDNSSRNSQTSPGFSQAAPSIADFGDNATEQIRQILKSKIQDFQE